MNLIQKYGWNDTLFQQKQNSQFSHLPHGRVTVVHKTCYEVISEDALFKCELAGNILFGKTPEEYPCTGDWVLFQKSDEQRGIILDILPRSKSLYRRRSGTVSTKQSIASHVDKAFIVIGLDANFSARRAERFIVQVESEGIAPILVLTKADISHNENDVLKSLSHLSSKMPIIKTSIYDSQSIETLKAHAKQGETVVFIGSSGVGKSSLVNALYGADLLVTSSLSDFSGKGRHTSTRREMILLEDSAVLIDTPGVREFGITVDDNELLSSVLDVSALEKNCKFKDCTHTGEPGCAVAEALSNGSLSEGVYESYLKLRKESQHFSKSEYERRKHEKSFSKMVNEVVRIKKK